MLYFLESMLKTHSSENWPLVMSEQFQNTQPAVNSSFSQPSKHVEAAQAASLLAEN